MSLSREQYDEIMRIISGRHQAAVRNSNLRQEELKSKLPEVADLNERIADLCLREAEARIRKNAGLAESLLKERRELVGKRNMLMKEAGYPEDYGSLKVYCEICGDTGYAGNEKCGCFKELESRILNRDSGLPALMEKENFSSFDMGIYDKNTYIEELKPREITQYDYMLKKVLPDIERYLEDFDGKSGRNILMFGPAGTGKTFLSNCIAKELIERRYSVVYERAGDMFRSMSRAEFSRLPSPEDESLEDRINSCDLFILDDLGTEFATEYTRGRLFSIISNRLSRELSTIITTNMSMSQLKSQYGERVSSRFIGEYMLIPFYGRDLRTVISKEV